MPSITEISQKLGLSKATVSRAFDLRQCEKVRRETRQRIFALCEELDYHPTFTGRSFSTGKTFKIGVLTQGYSAGHWAPGSLFPICIAALGGAVQKQGFALTMLYLDEGDNSAQIVDFLKSSIADGYVILSQLIDERVLEAVARCRQPVINVDYVQSGISGLPVVARDPVAAYRTAWAETTSPERAASVFIHFGHSSHKRDSLVKAAPPDARIADVVIPPCGNTLAGYRNAKIALNGRFGELAPYRTFWCSSDLIAMALRDCFLERGITPGREVKIAGFDNQEGTTAGFDAPVLSSVDPCWGKCGLVLADVILREIREGRRSADSVAVESEFVFRSSFPKKEG